MMYISIFDLVVLASITSLVIYEMIQGKSNCLFWASRKWLQRGIAGQETYLCFRITRIKYGIIHCLLGELDPTRYRINMMSYRPPHGHAKTGFAPVFKGSVIEGDLPDSHDEGWL